MERLTNQYSDLHKEIKIELSACDIDKDEKLIVYYSQMPWFPGGQFSSFLIEDILKSQFRLIIKCWNAKNDLEVFSSRVYNLDRLCIRTKSIELSTAQQKQCTDLLENIKTIPEKLESEGYILLDGVDYELKIKTNYIDKDYKWKIPTNDISIFRPLIDFLEAEHDE